MKLVLLCAISSMTFVDDQMYFVYFIMPLSFVLVAITLKCKKLNQTSISIFVSVGLGLLVGRAFLHVLIYLGVHVEGPPPIVALKLFGSVRSVTNALPAYMFENIWFLMSVTVLLIFAGSRFISRYASIVKVSAELHNDDLVFTLIAGLSVAGICVFTAAFFEDSGSFRYLTLASLWIVVFAARWLGEWRAGVLVCGVVMCSVNVADYLRQHRTPTAMFAFDTAVAQCIRASRDQLGLRAGLASYWNARASEVALNWSVQIDQITKSGGMDPWQTDPSWFEHDIKSPDKASAYTFIVMKDLDPAAIAVRYGTPTACTTARRPICGSTDDPQRIRSRLIGNAVRTAG